MVPPDRSRAACAPFGATFRDGRALCVVDDDANDGIAPRRFQSMREKRRSSRGGRRTRRRKRSHQNDEENNKHRSFASDAMSASTEEKEEKDGTDASKTIITDPKKKRCRRRIMTGAHKKGEKDYRARNVHVSAPGVRFWIHRIDSTEAQAAARRARLREHVCRCGRRGKDRRPSPITRTRRA